MAPPINFCETLAIMQHGSQIVWRGASNETKTPMKTKRCVITGGSSGIGAALAETFKHDYEIIGIDRDFQNAKKVMDALGPEARVRFIIAELSSRAGIERTVEELGQEPIATLIHSAGINAVVPFERTDIQMALTVLDVIEVHQSCLSESPA
ncbi:MAG: SDR family NAD(P)-dependent oxidoreductase [Trueperaceae bacterium]